MSRIEEQLKTLIDGSGMPVKPQSRIEIIFDMIISGDTDFPEPKSSFERYMIAVEEGESIEIEYPQSRVDYIFKNYWEGSEQLPPQSSFEDLLQQYLLGHIEPGEGVLDYFILDVDTIS